MNDDRGDFPGEVGRWLPPSEGSQAMPGPWKRHLGFIGKAVASAGLLLWIVSQAELRSILNAFQGADLRVILALFLTPYLGVAIVSSRWKILLSSIGVALPYGLAYRSCLVSIFFRQFLPSTVGGDVIRAYDCWRTGAGKSATLMSLVVDRLLGLLALIFFAVLALSFGGALVSDYPALRWWILGIALLLLFSAILFFVPVEGVTRLVDWFVARAPRRVRSQAGKVQIAATLFHGKTAGLGKGLILSVVMQLHGIAFYFLVSYGLGFGIPFRTFFLIVPVALMVMLLPVSINGIGLREGIFVFLLAPLGISAAQAVAFAWIEYSVVLSAGLVGGVVHALRREGRGRLGSEVPGSLL